jgi:hypothetical protein
MIYLRKGKESFTGRYVDYGWSVHSTGNQPEHFRTIGRAKAKAIELGASGKWRREVRPVGVRGRGIIHYFDSESGAK